MSKIYCLMGKSSSGKDTIFKELLKGPEGFRQIVSYTTRPIRVGEKEGVEYHFVDEQEYTRLLQSGKIIEHREYHTAYGIWRYFTADDGQFQLEGDRDYLMIGTLEAYESMRDYFGREKVLPVMIELDDGVRLERALKRERQQETPGYVEMCRRFLADSEDFAPEKIEAAGITNCFQNNDLDTCLDEIRAFIKEQSKSI